MKPHRLLFSILLLTFWITATWLYATSWLWPQCFAAWKLDNSYMLATHHGSLVCLFEFDTQDDSPSPLMWTFRHFSGNGIPKLLPSTGWVLIVYPGDPDPISAKRRQLDPLFSPCPSEIRFDFLGLRIDTAKMLDGLFTPSSPPSSTAPWIRFQFMRVIVPLWLLWIPLSLLTFFVTRATARRLRRQRLGLCMNCGYDLRASTDRCPECGEPVLIKNLSTAPLRNIPSQIFTGCKSHLLLTGTSICLLAIIIAFCWFTAPPRILYVHSAERAPTHPRLSEVLKGVEADHQSLEKVLNFLSDKTGVNIITDWPSLESVGIDRNIPISLHLTSVSLNSVLKEIRHYEPSIDFFVDDAGIVHIGTREQIASESSVTRVYDVRDFYELRNHNPLLPRSGHWNDHFSRIITETVAPESWRVNGGPCSIQEHGCTLIITAPRENQEKIADFLDQLRRHINPSSTP